jgi:DNA modification methylase
MKYEKKGKKSTNKKLLEKIQYSVKDKYGFLPVSILSLFETQEMIDYLESKNIDVPNNIDLELIVNDVINVILDKFENSQDEDLKSIKNFKITPELRNYIEDVSIVKRVQPNGGVASSRGGGFASKYDYSTFNPALADFLFKHYFSPNSKIFDPFSGRATRALIANKNEIHYDGWDVSQLTIKINQNKIYELEESGHKWYNQNYKINYYNEDGTLLNGIESNFYDGCLTCPPYFNIEKYESCSGQLSDYKKYEDFLEHYSNGFKRFYDVLKFTTDIDNFHPLVVVTGNFRINKRMVDFTGDTRRIAREAGFVLYDEIHSENNSPFVYLRSRQNEARRMVSKVHETVSVFIKLPAGVKSI